MSFILDFLQEFIGNSAENLGEHIGSSIFTHFEKKPVSVQLSSLTRQQKMAILRPLFIISVIDKNGHQAEIDLYDSIANMLVIEYSDRQSFIDDMNRITPKEHLKVLSTLNKEITSWYVTCLLNMVKADGKILKEELEQVDYIVQEIFFPQNEYLQIKKQLGI